LTHEGAQGKRPLLSSTP